MNEYSTSVNILDIIFLFMLRNTFFSLSFFLPFLIQAQPDWIWTELDTMPFKTSNNAVASAEVNGVPYVYSFAGIDTSKVWSGVHLKAARYDTQTGIWEQIADVPDTLGKIAAAASEVNGIIYVIGGYHVFNGSPYELSSNKVHRYDAQNNIWLSDGADIPVPIDDQVQMVWRDSLIIVVTGWSNSTNVDEVQIYDPANDVWTMATPVPNNSQFKVFGASGSIVGDTIYYYGGATVGFNFPAQKRLRKGVIDPTDPTNITWSQPSTSPGDNGYRNASISVGSEVFWIGGSGTSYNFDGVAYNGSGGVEPLTRILSYNSITQQWDEGLGSPYGVMDLRQAAQIAPNEFVIAGCMMSGQEVTNRVFHLKYIGTTSIAENTKGMIVSIHPNPSNGQFYLDVDRIDLPVQLKVFNVLGELVHEQKIYDPISWLDLSDLKKNAYQLKLYSEGSVTSVKFLLVN